MRIFLLSIAIGLFVFSALNFANLFKLEQNFILAGGALVLGIVFVALQDYCFYKQCKKKQAIEKAEEEARILAAEQMANA